MSYTFDAQKARGTSGKQFLDRRFTTEYKVRQATQQEQRRGIDRVFTNRQTGRSYAVEYKTDYKAAETGNAFVETISVDTAGKSGWAYSSKADLIIYYIPGDGLIYVLALQTLRRELPRWVQEYRLGAAQNEGYATHGVLVPLDEFERIAEIVISV